VKFEIGAMTVGDILDRGIRMLQHRLGTFLAIHLIVFWPALVFQFFVPGLLNNAFASMVAGSPQITPLLQLSASLMLYLFLWTILSCFSTAATLHVITQEFINERVGTGAALKYAITKFGPLLLTSILCTLLFSVGMIPCGVPFVFFWIWFLFSNQVVVAENSLGFRALVRSRDLTQGFRLRIVGLGVLFIVIWIVISILEQLLQIPFPAGHAVRTERGVIPVYDTNNFVLVSTIGFIFGTIFQTFADICWTLFYFDLRIRKEGYDLELAAKKQPIQSSESAELA
jgi:hypothetical protein